MNHSGIGGVRRMKIRYNNLLQTSWKATTDELVHWQDIIVVNRCHKISNIVA